VLLMTARSKAPSTEQEDWAPSVAIIFMLLCWHFNAIWAHFPFETNARTPIALARTTANGEWRMANRQRHTFHSPLSRGGVAQTPSWLLLQALRHANRILGYQDRRGHPRPSSINWAVPRKPLRRQKPQERTSWFRFHTRLLITQNPRTPRPTSKYLELGFGGGITLLLPHAADATWHWHKQLAQSSN